MSYQGTPSQQKKVQTTLCWLELDIALGLVEDAGSNRSEWPTIYFFDCPGYFYFPVRIKSTGPAAGPPHSAGLMGTCDLKRWTNPLIIDRDFLIINI